MTEANHLRQTADDYIARGFFKQTNDQYFHGPGIGSHMLMDMLRTPSHFYDKHILKKETDDDEESESMSLGDMIHHAILQPEEFKRRARAVPECDRRTKDGKEIYKAFLETCPPDALILKPKLIEKMDGMLARIETRPRAKKLLYGGKFQEFSGYWRDAETGIVLRMKPDVVHENGIIVDLKSTKDARANVFSRDINKYHYDLQAAMYSAGYEAITGEKPKAFIHLACENISPHETVPYKLDSMILERGRMKFRTALDRYAECLKKNEWPGYGDDIVEITYPIYILQEEF